jgi:Protein of unknown function (DUF1403)/Segregation and condensation complex subunit ScpB
MLGHDSHPTKARHRRHRDSFAGAAAGAGLGAARYAGHRHGRGRVPGRRRTCLARWPGGRLALKAAAASARIARRGEDEATLRDAFFLRHGGDDPGPAGRMLVAWRGLDRSAPLADDSVLHLAETLQLTALEKLVLTAVAYFQPVTRAGVADILCRNISRDVIAALRGAGLIATGPRSPQPGAPHTYVTTQAFLTLWGLASLRDLPDLARLEDAGLLGKAPLPEELRGALGIRGNEEEEDRAEIDVDEDREVGEDYGGIGLVEE